MTVELSVLATIGKASLAMDTVEDSLCAGDPGTWMDDLTRALRSDNALVIAGALTVFEGFLESIHSSLTTEDKTDPYAIPESFRLVTEGDVDEDEPVLNQKDRLFYDSLVDDDRRVSVVLVMLDLAGAGNDKNIRYDAVICLGFILAIYGVPDYLLEKTRQMLLELLRSTDDPDLCHILEQSHQIVQEDIAEDETS